MNKYLIHLVDVIFKILPLKEETDSGIDVGLYDYIDSVVIQVVGGKVTYKELEMNLQYISIINSINYLNSNNFTHKQCKREVFRCINTLKNLL